MSRAKQAKKGQKEELVHRLWGRTERRQYGLKVREEVTLKIREVVTPKVRERVALKVSEEVTPEVRESHTSTTGPEALFPTPRWVHRVLFPPR